MPTIKTCENCGEVYENECRYCNSKIKAQVKADSKALVEGEDFYYENGLMVLTRKYLLNRGYCCSSGCRHCPYQSTN